MIDRLINRGLNAELIAALLFSIVSGLYITTLYGPGKILDILFTWMFPASVMVFLTLLFAKIIERFHNRQVTKHTYIDWVRRK